MTSDLIGVRRAPITGVAAGQDSCGLTVDPDILRDSNKTDTLKLMLAAAYEGVGVVVNIGGTGGSGDLIMYREKFIGPMNTLTDHAVNARLIELPAAPVRTFRRGPKSMQWELTLRFRAQRQHIAVLEKLPEIVRAMVAQDPLYDGYMLELFVPEGAPPLLEEELSGFTKEELAERAKIIGPTDPPVDEHQLRKKIVEALAFDLGLSPAN